MKLFNKVAAFAVGLSLAAGVGTGIAVSSRSGIKEARAESTITYVFNSKSWGATIGDDSANWTSGKDGNQFTADQGVQISTASTGANATSPSSFTGVSTIDVQYCTNNKTGVGTIKVQVGSGTEKSFNVTAPSSGGTTLKTASFTFSPSESGNVTITGNCTTNSIYIYSISITATAGGAETVTGSGTVNFGNASGSIAVNANSVSGTDTLGNTWNVASPSAGYYSQADTYSQIGSGNNPASSITFSCNFSEELTVTSFSAKFGGFSGTAGTVTFYVGSTSVGSGSLNASSDVTLNATSSGSGESMSIVITNISKGVKAYYISYTLSSDDVGDVSVESLTIGDDFSLAKGQTQQVVPDIVPANATDKSVTFSTSNPTVASVSSDGLVTALAIGTSTITCTSNDNSSATDSVVVTVTKAIPTNLIRGATNNYFEIGTILSTYFTESSNTLTVKYSDDTSKKVLITDTNISIKLGDETINPSHEFVAADDGKKISIFYTEDDTTVFTNINIYVKEALAITSVEKSFAGNKEYLLVDDETSTLSGEYVSLYGEPTITVTSSVSSVIGLDSTCDELTYNNSNKTGTFTIALFAYSAGMSSITIELDYGSYTDSYTTDSIVVRTSDPEVSGYYEKITSADELVGGQYLIVYEEGSVAFDGGLATIDVARNSIPVTIDDETIGCTETTAAAEFTIDASQGYVKDASGKYISVGSYKNGLVASSDAVSNDIDFDENGNVLISKTFDGGTMTLKYNKATDQARFRYYTSGQQDIQLYKYIEDASSEDFDVALAFVNTFMHTEIAFSDQGTGSCISQGWYIAAKTAFFNQSGLTDTGYLQNVEQRTIVANDFSDYFARLQAWAAANNESIEFGTDDYVVVSLANRSIVKLLENNSEAAAVIVSVTAMVTLTAVGGFFFLKKKPF